MSDDRADSDKLAKLEDQVIHGDKQSLADIFSLYRERLRRIVNFRIDRHIYGRIDSEDILQEAYLNAEQRLKFLLRDRPATVFIWLRQVVNQTLIDVHRRHLGAQKRNAGREVSIYGGWSSDSTSMSLTFHLLGHLTSPSVAALRTELAEHVDRALSGMSDFDREILALRHFEELSNLEAAQVLNVTAQTASMRYVRAVSRLRQVLEAIPGFEFR